MSRTRSRPETGTSTSASADLYNGLAIRREAEPRVGVAYSVKPSNTVLSLSYARTMETPFNENLVVSSLGCAGAVLAPLLSCTPGVQGILQPGFRNEFHASLQQAVGKFAVISGEIHLEVHAQRLRLLHPGKHADFLPHRLAQLEDPWIRASRRDPQLSRLQCLFCGFISGGSLFPPQVAGAGATVGQSGLPFRIDHDEIFNQTTHLNYTINRDGIFSRVWGWFNWRYDSGLVAGSVPCCNVVGANTLCTGTSITLPNGQPGVDLSGLTPDQQFRAGIVCDGVRATPTSGFTNCDNSGYKSSLVQIPRSKTEDDDKNPPRIARRNLFDVSVGKNNIFHRERYKLDLNLTAIVTPRTLTANLTLNF